MIWDSPLTAALNTTVAAPLGQAGSAVDLGCGTGLSAAELVRRGWQVTGVDSSAPMLARAAGRHRVTGTVLADAANTPLPPGSADVVIVSHVLHLHPDPGAVLAEAWRLTAPGGSVICVWPAPGATLATAFRADLGRGRPLAAAVRAAGLRWLVGLFGAALRARRWSGAAVLQVVTEWAERTGCEPQMAGVLAGLEEYRVYRRPSGSADGTAAIRERQGHANARRSGRRPPWGPGDR